MGSLLGIRQGTTHHRLRIPRRTHPPPNTLFPSFFSFHFVWRDRWSSLVRRGWTFLSTSIACLCPKRSILQHFVASNRKESQSKPLLRTYGLLSHLHSSFPIVACSIKRRKHQRPQLLRKKQLNLWLQPQRSLLKSQLLQLLKKRRL